MTSSVKVIAAIDDSPVSATVLQRAASLVDNAAGELRVVMVIPPVVGHWASLESRAFTTPTPVQTIENALAQDFRRRVSARVREAGLSEEVIEVRYGRPEQEILDCAADHEADLIVVGGHGKGFLERLMIGSTAEAVLHHATCNVLLIAPREGDT